MSRMRKRTSQCYPRRSGFTLMELLVSIGIVAVLASVLLVATKTVAHKGRQAKSMQNMRTLLSVDRMAMGENNNRLAPYQNYDGHYWFMYLPRDYLQGDYRVLIAPGDDLKNTTNPSQKRAAFENVVTKQPAVVQYSYARNLSLPMQKAPNPLPPGWKATDTYALATPVARIEKQSATALLLETGYSGGLTEAHSIGQLNYFRFSSPDKDRMLVGFLDGSVREVGKNVIFAGEAAGSGETEREHRQMWFGDPEATAQIRF